MAKAASIPTDLRLFPFRARDAVAAGALSRSALRGRSWRRLLPGIYITGSVEIDHRAWCRAAALWAGPAAAVSGRSAAYLWGVADVPDDGVVEVTAAEIRRVQSGHVRIVRSPLGVADIEDVAGIPVTTAVRTAFDMARRLQLVEAVVLIDALLGRRVLRVSDLISYVASHPRWPGDAQAAKVIGLVEPRAESPMETRLRLVIVNGGLPRPVAQYEVRDAGGRFIGRLDLAYPEWKVAIEYDGDHHRDRATFRDDIRRANALRVAGWTVLRFTASDVWRRPEQIVADICAVIPS